MSLETGMFVLSLIGVFWTVLLLFALVFPKTKIGTKLFPPPPPPPPTPPFSSESEEFTLLKRITIATEELARQGRLLPVNPPVADIVQDVEMVTTVRRRRRGTDST